jgi:hypothetical protein
MTGALDVTIVGGGSAGDQAPSAHVPLTAVRRKWPENRVRGYHRDSSRQTINTVPNGVSIAAVGPLNLIDLMTQPARSRVKLSA